jgi:hypothetical protein
MYLLDEVAKEIQKERLAEAEKERLLKPARRQTGGLQAQLSNKLGDWLITNGLKLKSQSAAPAEIAWEDCSR